MDDSTPRLSFLPDFPGREILYHPLNANKAEIRVITVHPSNDRSSAIHCSLQTISIRNGQSTKPYDAISYFWGSTLITETIIVHDEIPADQFDHCVFEVPVTPALAGAIRQFRAKYTASGEPLVLWTDAVCINQRDAAERSHQVTIMRCVYQAATLVLVWLGEGDSVAEKGLVDLLGIVMCLQTNMADRDHAIDDFDYCNSDAQPDLESLERVAAIFKTASKADVYGIREDVKDRGADMDSWLQTVSTLLDLPYWYRGWTFQEACANEHVLLHYGQTRCRIKRWESLPAILFNDLGVLGAQHVPAFREFFHWVHNVNIAHASAPYFNDDYPMPKDYAKRILAYCIDIFARHKKQTSDPRDQVYSQIGTIVGFRLLNIKPDYTLKTEQVFMATTISILCASQSWSCRHFYIPSKSPFLPSWAIDFTLSTDGDSDKFAMYCASFNADLDSSFRLQMSRSGSLLTAGFIHDDAVIVEPCDRVGRETGPKTDWNQWFVILLATPEIWRYLRKGTVPTSLDLWESFCRTLCMGKVGGAKFEPEHSVACRDEESFENAGSSSVVWEILKWADFAQRNAMNFIVTRSGRLGLAPRDIYVGDRIAILASGTVPFILRKVGGARGSPQCLYTTRSLPLGW